MVLYDTCDGNDEVKKLYFINVDDAINLANDAMRQMNFKKALILWEVVRKKFPKRHQGYTRASAAYLELGNYAQAEALSKEGMEQLPGAVNPLISFAEVAMRQRNFEEALRRWAVVRRRFPKNHHGYTRASAAYLELRDYAQAEALSKEVMEQLPGAIKPLIAFSEVAMRQRNFEEALCRWTLVRDNFPENHISYTRAVAACLKLGDYDQAEALCKEGMERLPEAIEPLMAFANVAMHQCNFEEALCRWTVVRNKFPSCPPGYTRACAACIEMADWVQAEALTKEAMQKMPERLEPYLAYSDIFIRQEKFAEAEDYLKTIPEHFFKNPAYISKVLGLRRLSGKTDNDFKLLEHQVGLNSMLDALILVSNFLKDSDEIEKVLEKQAFSKELKAILRKYFNKKIEYNNVFKNYNFKVISLGPSCWLAGLFSRWGLRFKVEDRMERLPFCVAWHCNSDTIIKVLNSKFEGYCLEENIFEFLNCESKPAYKNLKLKIHFNHDLVSYYRSKSHFVDILRERVENFIRASKDEYTLYVHQGCENLSPEQIESFINIKRSMFASDSCLLLLVENSNAPLKYISYNTYVMGIAKAKVRYNTREFVMSEEGCDIETSVVEAITTIIQKHFPKRETPLTQEAIEQQMGSSYQDELFDDIQMREFVRSIKEKVEGSDNIGSIVMNCNPFTNGHKFLVEHAATQVDKLVLFVVEEDKSFFKFQDRIELVRQGVAHLKNVIVVPSGKFIISTATFPSYFFKDNPELGAFDATKDVTFFGKYIASALGIKVRFLGTEPNCRVTRQYNEQMHEILPKYGVAVEEISRKNLGEAPISASLVRKYLEDNDFDKIWELVPETTYIFLKNRAQCQGASNLTVPLCRTEAAAEDVGGV